DPDPRQLSPVLRQVVSSPELWELLRVDGLAVVVRWKESPAGRVRVPPFDAERLAFRSEDSEACPPAPGDGPAELPLPHFWWDRFLERPSGSSWETDAAAVYLRLFEENSPQQTERQHLAVLGRHAAGVVSLPAAIGGHLPSVVGLATRLTLGEVFMPDLREQ